MSLRATHCFPSSMPVLESEKVVSILEEAVCMIVFEKGSRGSKSEHSVPDCTGRETGRSAEKRGF